MLIDSILLPPARNRWLSVRRLSKVRFRKLFLEGFEETCSSAEGIAQGNVRTKVIRAHRKGQAPEKDNDAPGGVSARKPHRTAKSSRSTRNLVLIFIAQERFDSQNCIWGGMVDIDSRKGKCFAAARNLCWRRRVVLWNRAPLPKWPYA
jgi:hypothetical protein